MITFPNAKINIGLNVVSKRPDGYHNLETIYYPIKLSDALEVVPSEKNEITFSGLRIDGDQINNLVLRAYRLLKDEHNLPHVKFHLHKVIPFGAGLGGGSADAAFTLKMLNEFFNIGLTISQLEEYATKIGADCAFFLHNKPIFATGTGNQFKPVNFDLSDYHIVIIKPDVQVNTTVAYQNIVPQKPKYYLPDLINLPITDWRESIVNDFEKSVFIKFPQLSELKKLLYSLGAEYASMSGSGSALYGIFRHLPVVFEKKIPEGVLIYR